jgi:hypothetical protein
MDIEPQEPILDLRQLCDLPPDAEIIDINGWQDPDDKGFPCYVRSESAGATWRIDISIKVAEPYVFDPRRRLRAVP